MSSGVKRPNGFYLLSSTVSMGETTFFLRQPRVGGTKMTCEGTNILGKKNGFDKQQFSVASSSGSSTTQHVNDIDRVHLR